MPLLMVGLMFAPMLIMKYSGGDEKHIAVIDESGLIAPRLQSGKELIFESTDLSTEAARKELTDKFGVLYIGSDILTNPNNVKLYANSSSSLSVESNITGQIEGYHRGRETQVIQHRKPVADTSGGEDPRRYADFPQR